MNYSREQPSPSEAAPLILTPQFPVMAPQGPAVPPLPPGGPGGDEEDDEDTYEEAEPYVADTSVSNTGAEYSSQQRHLIGPWALTPPLR